jgi:hypothetical protein
VKLFPFTREGRHTLIYLVFAGSGIALTAFVWWFAENALHYRLFGTFTELARVVAAALLVTDIALGMFVSIRAIKIGPGGLDATGNNNDDSDKPDN